MFCFIRMIIKITIWLSLFKQVSSNGIVNIKTNSFLESLKCAQWGYYTSANNAYNFKIHVILFEMFPSKNNNNYKFKPITIRYMHVHACTVCVHTLCYGSLVSLTMNCYRLIIHLITHNVLADEESPCFEKWNVNHSTLAKH